MRLKQFCRVFLLRFGVTKTLGAACLALWSSVARAAPEPWSDADPAEPAKRYAFEGKVGEKFGVTAGVEYRAQATSITPLTLSSNVDSKAFWIEHRGRVDAALDYDEAIRLTTSIDILDSVLWGDNGTLGKAPEADSGANVNARNVNVSRICTVYGSGPEYDASSYRYGLCPADPLYVRRLYADVVTPIGLFRIGRQPTTVGSTVALNDADGRTNRFGVAYRGNQVDRILFATKPLEAFKPKDKQNLSEHEGLIVATGYDHVVNDSVVSHSDNVHQWFTALLFMAPKYRFGRDLEARLFHSYRWDAKNSSSIHALGGRLTSRVGNFYAGFDTALFFGTTREVSAAYAVISNDPVVDQRVLEFGARAVVRYDQPAWSLYLEGDYASGESDPSNRAPLTQFRFSEDTNVGLLMFKQVLAYQTARAAAAGVALLKNLQAPTIPIEAIASRGSFTGAAALFPQIDVRPIDNLFLRGGVLFARAPQGVVDPIQSQQRKKGSLTVQEANVNFAGGAPGSYYGTEIDLRAQYRFKKHFIADLEGAVLFPGGSLEDENGRAVRSVLVQGRTTVFF